MEATPYLFFKGTCREAFETYAKVFNTPAPELMSFSSLPEEDKAHMPGVPDDAVMHGSMKIGDSLVYGSDDLMGEFTPMAGCSMAATLPDEAATRAAFEALSEGGEVRMPLAPMFWTPLFGTLTDRFGIRWMVMAEGSAA
ncbi:VOC family protein [Oceanicola sp. D3]|uniref:VOC family protein n=1 Tax=Oceanicola sp. D3 TaxID=2587163 RepID=UPI0011228A0E|nr:VOC family protein [Oceanicola sp. D3]QDC10832.1 VOC family protein [Oceanicola sp. D3]